jgi:hypothetical protein
VLNHGKEVEEVEEVEVEEEEEEVLMWNSSLIGWFPCMDWWWWKREGYHLSIKPLIMMTFVIGVVAAVVGVGLAVGVK